MTKGSPLSGKILVDHYTKHEKKGDGSGFVDVEYWLYASKTYYETLPDWAKAKPLRRRPQ